MDLSRRQFFKLGGAGVAAIAGITAFGLETGAKTTTVSGKKVEYKHGVCGMCEMSCAYIGKIENGRLVKLEGNPLDQHSRGSLCAKGNAGINMLYDPDRFKAPMLKTTAGRVPGADPKWKKLDWDKATELAASEIKKAIDKYGPQSVIWIGHHRGTDFLKAIGSPNDISHQSTCNAVRQLACQNTLGTINYVPDMANSKYIMCFGWDQVGKAKNSLARALIEGKANGAKLIVFDPRFSTTASKADEWIPIRPGTDLAVILAMLNIVITEQRYNPEFVAQNTAGFEELAVSITGYTPEWAEGISNVPAETIKRIAREFSSGIPAVIPIHKREAIQSHPGGFELVRACLGLMAITGNVEREGGALLPRTASISFPKAKETAPQMKVKKRVDGGHLFPLAVTGPLAGPGLYQSVPDMILNNKPYPVKVAIIYAQSLQSMPNPDKWVKAFSKLDFIININSNPDDMSTIADLVLPESVYLERAEIAARSTNAKYQQIAIGEPMIKPLFDTLDAGEIIKLIAEKLGVDQYLPPGGNTMLNFKLKKYNVTFREALDRGGLISGSKAFKPMDLTKLKTESGKIQLHSPKLQESGYNPVPYYDSKWVLTPKTENEFYLVTTRPPMHRHTKSHNMRWLHQIMPEGYVLVNADRAKKLNIKDGDMVQLETSYGKGQGKAKLTQGIRPDTICIPHGFGQKTPFMRLAKNDGFNDGEIMPCYPKEKNIELKDPAGACLDCNMLVKMRRV
ncbi:MAG: molybdopterin-dependent oxidoreductase [Syntrophomonas sp.]